MIEDLLRDLQTLKPSEPFKVLEVATPNCVAEEFDGEIVALNVASGVYYSLGDLAAAVWRDLASGYCATSLVTEITNIDDVVANQVQDLICDLEQRGLMRQASLSPSAKKKSDSIEMVRNGEKLLTFQAFDDMKDLIQADPIHDVEEEMGWPVLRRNEAE